MKVYRDLSTSENRKLWEAIDAAEQVVARWPTWKRGATVDFTESIPAGEEHGQTGQTGSRHVGSRAKAR